MLSNRLQILIDDDRRRRLVAEAARRNVPVAEVVRDAIDAFLAPDLEVKRLAWAEIQAISGRDPMPVPARWRSFALRSTNRTIDSLIMIVIDTPVLLYAVGTEHPLRGPAVAVLAAGCCRGA